MLICTHVQVFVREEPTHKKTGIAKTYIFFVCVLTAEPNAGPEARQLASPKHPSGGTKWPGVLSLRGLQSSNLALCTHTHAYRHIHTQHTTHTNTHTHHTRAHIHTCVCRVCKYVSKYKCVHVCMHVCVKCSVCVSCL